MKDCGESEVSEELELGGGGDLDVSLEGDATPVIICAAYSLKYATYQQRTFRNPCQNRPTG